MNKNESIKIDKRRFSELFALLKERVPHYTPKWAASDKNDPGVALLKIFSYINEMVIHHYNQVPDKNFIAFLDMLGIELLPAQSSRVPLTFKLAKGTDKEILIPDRTQASADKTDDHEELPFESDKNLLAIFSKLMQAITVDPKEDAIYLAPPNFLDDEKKDETKIKYKIVTSLKEEENKLQLDHVTELEEGNLLKIEFKDVREYHTIKEIAGNIVILTDKLIYSYPIDSKVKKISNFTLYESENMQEHSLYIGQKDLFNVKSKATFVFSVSYHQGSQGSTPLKTSWEYWGEKEGEEEENWYKFQVKNDTTGRLSNSGEIELVKSYEGEIKEKEINGIKNRWIRCKVEDKLVVDEPIKLPVFEDIMFRVKSAGENLFPDLLFNNDIPLDPNKTYAPFGKEPRIYDQFVIANKEVFSKKGASVTLDLDVEGRGVLGAPAAILYSHTKSIKVFARGTGGRLIEVNPSYSSSSKNEWFDHGFPEGTTIAKGATPSIPKITDKSNRFMFVFIKAENGHLVECLYNGTQWQWLDHGFPEEGVSVAFDPFSIYASDTTNTNLICVFVTGTNGSIYIFYRKFDSDEIIGTWKIYEESNNMIFDSSPFALILKAGSADGITLNIFVKSKEGYLCELTYDAIEHMFTDFDVKDLPKYENEEEIKINSKPFAIKKANGTPASVVVFINGSDGRLWKFDDNTWTDLNAPEGVEINLDPHGDSATEIFVKDSHNFLWEYDENADPDTWKPHNSPPNLKLNSSPFVLIIGGNTHIFSLSDKDSIIERSIENNENFIWNDYKDSNETALDPLLSWEYWNKKGWVVLKDIKDQTSNLLQSGSIKFDIPLDIEETEVSGQKNYWIRARVVGGDYGKEIITYKPSSAKTKPDTVVRSTVLAQSQSSLDFQIISDKNAIRPPVISSLTINYDYEAKQQPQHCLAYNNLTYIDHTEASVTPNKYFEPFMKLEDVHKTLYLGFEKQFKGGPIKILFDAKELPFSESKKPKVEWTYHNESSWEPLSFRDDTESFIKADILQFLMPDDLSGDLQFGHYLYWMKGELVKGAYEKDRNEKYHYPEIRGIYPNTTWALQAETIKDEIIGSGNAEANQTFTFFKSPVLEGEEVRVKEILTEDEKHSILDTNGEESIVEIKNETKEDIEKWVLWRKVSNFFDSSENDRHYTLDRATGQITFGDGIHGKIPPFTDDNIKAFVYQSGGGKGGNVKAKEVKTLKSSIAAVDKVINHIAADGGADTATVNEMLKIGPAMISHRNRAVTVEDFEWLSRQASRKVAKVRCLPTVDNNNIKKAGFVTVIIIPDSTESQPKPSLELKRKVKRYLEDHCANTISNPHHIYIKEPTYVTISIYADVYVTSIDTATETEYKAKSKLNALFHPLSGGVEGKGWEFGRDVAISDIYALIEPIDGVDHIENIRFAYNSVVSDSDIVEIADDFIVANGKHEFNIKLRKGG